MGPKISAFRSFKAHKAHIMDVIEIISPCAIATCSLDHKIKLWDLSLGIKLGSLNPCHTTGVRSLDYTPDYSGYIVSVGHENIIKVWSPEVSIHRAYVGCLEGHNSAVMTAKFIKNSPFLISVDEKLNLRVWDIRGMACVQVISQTHKKYACNGMCVIGSEHKFVLYGRRLLMYDTVLDKVGKKELKPVDDAYPFKVVFNSYTKTFVIATKIDVRLHDCNTGQLIKIFSNFANGEKQSDNTAFCMDGNHRRFFVGDVYGSVRVYNASNGIFMKSVGETEYMEAERIIQRDFTSAKNTTKMATELVKIMKRDHTKEISNLHYVKGDHLVLTASYDSIINIYDDENPDETPRLRNLKGGHGDSPITCMEYCDYLSLIATGSSNGYITIWDFEMSRIEGICFGHTREILCLKFLDPYPLLISSSTDGIINIWGLRGVPMLMRYSCLCSLMNISKTDFGSLSLAIPSITVFMGKQSGVAKNMELYNAEPEEKVRRHYFKNMGGFEKDNVKGKRRRLSLEEEKRVVFIDHKKLQPEDDVNELAKVQNRCYVVFGDEKGKIRILDFTKLITETLNIEPVANYRIKNEHFNPKRKENNDYSSRIHGEMAKYIFG